MTLESIKILINDGKLEEFKGVSVKQIDTRLKRAFSYYKFANNALGSIKEEDYIVIYTNLYSAARILADTFLLANDYRVKKSVKDYHKVLLQAAKLVMADSGLDALFRRLDIMRINRNKIDYDAEILDISDQTLKQAIEDIKIFAAKVREAIRNKTA